MDEVKVIEVIFCTKQRRGDGIITPVRVVTEIFSTAGNLMATNDVYTVTLEQVREVYKSIPGDAGLTLNVLLQQLGLPVPGMIG